MLPVETVCLKFSIPKTQPASEKRRSWKYYGMQLVINALRIILPIANPDFESKIDDVDYWLVECDKVSGIPQREIGMAINGEVILKMPFKNNYGYWTDNNLLLEDFKVHFAAFEVSCQEFDRYWGAFK